MRFSKRSPSTPTGSEPINTHQSSRPSLVSSGLPSRIPLNAPANIRASRPRKYTSTETHVPSWITTSKLVRKGSPRGMCSSASAILRWAVEETGRNSVSPWTTPRIVASSRVMGLNPVAPAGPQAPPIAEPLGALLPAGEILLLRGRQRIDLHAHRGQLELGDRLVDLLRHRVDLLLELLVVLRHVLRGEGLVGEAHVHDARGVTLGGGQVHETPFRQNDDPAPALERELLDEVANG